MPVPRPSEQATRRLVLAAIFVAAAAILLPLSRRGLVLSDEGYVLHQAVEMARGRVLYRDLSTFVAPGHWLLLAGLFSVAEPSVWIARIPVLVATSGTVALGFSIVERVAGRRSGAAAAALLLAAAVWAFPAWSHSLYSPLAVFTASCALDLLLVWSADRGARRLPVIGAAVGATILLKQSYGALVACAALASLSILRPEDERALRTWLRDAARLTAGMAAAGALPVAYLASKGALAALLQAVVIAPFETLGKFATPYPPPWRIFDPRLFEGAGFLTYASTALVHTGLPPGWPPSARGAVLALHAALYWIAPAALAAAILVAGRSEAPVRGRLATLLVFSGALYAGLFPLADFTHLMQAYAPIVMLSVCVVAIAARGAARRSRPLARTLLVASVALAVGHVAAAVSWYPRLIAAHDVRVRAERADVLLQHHRGLVLQSLLDTIESSTPAGGALFTLPDVAMLNFLSDRPQPGRYSQLYAHMLPAGDDEGVVAAVERARPRLAITRGRDFFSARTRLRDDAPRLMAYLETRFEPAAVMGAFDFVVYRWRPVSRPPRPPSTALLPGCDPVEAQRIEDLLAAPLLLHEYGAQTRGRSHESTTICRLAAIPGDTLVVGLGRYPAEQVGGNALLEWEVSIETEGSPPRLVYARRMRDTATTAEVERPPPEWVRIDLGAGSEGGVVVRLTTRLTGRVSPLRHSLAPFGLYWYDPRLE